MRYTFLMTSRAERNICTLVFTCDVIQLATQGLNPINCAKTPLTLEVPAQHFLFLAFFIDQQRAWPWIFRNIWAINQFQLMIYIQNNMCIFCTLSHLVIVSYQPSFPHAPIWRPVWAYTAVDNVTRQRSERIVFIFFIPSAKLSVRHLWASF